ncbi:hypothetical protein M406DRAFT_73649 [Cryphonectria parasitica EP155]|uniref:Uncharacterized protein n=1 Tax=Cryphonectria parasitica (strain ATCC 38755 / EP155) TaxID=660469 RepID=A0A9P4XYQ8_CRYP1|nr:uncharacterized protein M406DRAFT_73649 [Cryphonectria parasitica EP155]KAF3762990.1 hypothetical protein M406DRAFT_73649 [Cryphonectria parasitica EP155]
MGHHTTVLGPKDHMNSAGDTTDTTTDTEDPLLLLLPPAGRPQNFSRASMPSARAVAVAAAAITVTTTKDLRGRSRVAPQSRLSASLSLAGGEAAGMAVGMGTGLDMGLDSRGIMATTAENTWDNVEEFNNLKGLRMKGLSMKDLGMKGLSMKDLNMKDLSMKGLNKSVSLPCRIRALHLQSVKECICQRSYGEQTGIVIN